MSSHHLSTLSDALIWKPSCFWFEGRGNEVKLLNDEVFGIENVFEVLIPFFQNVKVTCIVNNCLGQQRQHTSFGQRIIDKQILLLLFGWILTKLLSQENIPHTDTQRRHGYSSTVHWNHKSSPRQGCQVESKSFLLSLNNTEELSVFIHTRNLIQDVLPRNFVIVEHDESIVDDVETSFRTTVTNDNTRQDFVSFRIANRSDKCVNAVVFAVEVQICPNYRHVGYISHSANPKLHRILWRRM